MYEEIIQALADAEKNKDCVVAMVTGAGDYYCSGNDLSNFAKIPPEGPAAMARQGKGVLQYVKLWSLQSSFHGKQFATPETTKGLGLSTQTVPKGSALTSVLDL